ncbi:YcjX family protein [Pseudoroseicyclus tamaricis]|uniref:YcjX family protein n=1 Tax=Pseudoroseicyclus tamaricis TaxID=2705421 RepID=A0A6B2JTX6_9RHOB|nr:YcjX family protein [Pseudoroseicyclus tamaricis]NDV01997.1 YcjX family protein [Pseudoroseicyclus tamaricis]
MVISNMAEGLLRGVEGATDRLTAPFSDPVVRLGVTGLSEAGKTVFITSLVANLLDRGRMPGLRAAAASEIRSVWLQPQPDDTLPRFDYEAHRARLTGENPAWPEGTRRISQLRLSFRIEPAGFFSRLAGPQTVHLDIVDYPGEWLLDLGLMEKSFADWSAEVISRARRRPVAAPWLAELDAADPGAKLEEPDAQALAGAFTAYLHAARKEGYADLGPGRFLLPGDMEGSPVLTFAPLPPGQAPRGSLAHEFERRYESYKRNVVKPFFREHFARIDRQVVLIDVLGALHSGPQAFDDLRLAMADILSAFRPGRASWLTRAFGGRRVERILFAATKADHLHHTQHGALSEIAAAMLREAKDRADFAGATTAAMAIASLRTTVEDKVSHQGAELSVVKGRVAGDRQAAFHPGTLPSDPGHLLHPAREGAAAWADDGYAAASFLPARVTLKPGEGPPHIRLDSAAEFLFGDKL